MKQQIIIGTRGDVVHTASLDTGTGELSDLRRVGDLQMANWLAAHPRLKIVYAPGGLDGRIVAYGVQADGELIELSQVQTVSGIAHIWIDEPSMTLLVAGYEEGTTSTVPILPDGRLGEPTSVVVSEGTGPAARQDASHPHGVVVDPSGRFAVVADFGADRVNVYPFDREAEPPVLRATATAGSFVAAPGAGPRLSLFHPTLDVHYVVNELAADVDVLAWSSETGALSLLQNISTDAPDFAGERSAASIWVHPNGRHLYISNRGDDTIVVFDIDPLTGMLELRQRAHSQGSVPWCLTVDSTHTWMLVGNLASSRLDVLRIDAETGELEPTGQSLDVPQPSSLAICVAR